MKSRTFFYGLLALALGALMISVAPTKAIESWTQTLVNDLAAGPSPNGSGVLQVGEVSTLSAPVAAGTLTQVVAAPTAGTIYIRGIWINKAATSTGSILLRDGTGTNCASGTTHTILSLTAASGQTFPLGYQPIGIQVPGTKRALCAITEGANTSVQVLAQ